MVEVYKILNNDYVGDGEVSRFFKFSESVQLKLNKPRARLELRKNVFPIVYRINYLKM